MACSATGFGFPVVNIVDVCEGMIVEITLTYLMCCHVLFLYVSVL